MKVREIGAAVAAVVVFGMVGGSELSVYKMGAANAGTSPRVPRCAEDEYLQGVGEFSRGRWTRYVCAHIDDSGPEWIENDFRNPAVYATVRGSVCEHPRFWKREVGIVRAVSETCS